MHKAAIIAICILYALLTWWVKDHSFFWDSVLLGSVYGDWYYSHNFRHLFVPADIAGYPPLFGMYLAAGWKLFGKSLAVSHWLMLPFLWGIVLQVYLLVRKVVPAPWVVPGMLLLLLEPTLLAQSTQVAPDVILVFLYLLALNAILSKQRILLAVGVVFLALLSPRGTIAVVALFVTDFLLDLPGSAQDWFRYGINKMLAYVPAFLLTLGWLILHYQHFGWIGYDPNSQWGTYTKLVDMPGFFRNILILIWRLLDFGRLAIWLVGLLLLGILYKNKSAALSSPVLKKLLFIFLVPLLVYAAVLLPYTNPIGHRYLIVIYLGVTLVVLYLLAQVDAKRLQLGLYVLMLSGCIGGHFIVYPERVAQGWDGSLAHMPYFSLRRQMIQWMDQQHIPVETTGSAFPNLYPIGVIELNNDPRAFKEFDLSSDPFIFYSNVYNDFSDQALDELTKDWMLLHEFKKGQVYIRLYQSPFSPGPD